MTNTLFEKGKFYTTEPYSPEEGLTSQLHEAVEVYDTHAVLLPLAQDPSPFAVFYNKNTARDWHEATDYQLHRNWKRARLEKTELLNQALRLDSVINRVWAVVPPEEENNNEVNL